jgi:hypothetical protein
MGASFPAQFARANLFREKIRVHAHPLEHNAGFLDFVDEQPVGFDVALPPAYIVADQPVIAVEGIEALTRQESAGDNLELLQVFATAYRPERTSDAQPGEQVVCVFADNQVAPGVGQFKGPQGGGRGNGHLKGQAIAEFYLPVEQRDGLSGVQPQALKHPLRAFLQGRLDPRPDSRCLAHGFTSAVFS